MDEEVQRVDGNYLNSLIQDIQPLRHPLMFLLPPGRETTGTVAILLRPASIDALRTPVQRVSLSHMVRECFQVNVSGPESLRQLELRVWCGSECTLKISIGTSMTRLN